jgi:hypothetical protein
MTTRLTVGVAVALALVAGSARAGAGPRTVQTSGWIESVALEGSLAAYDVQGGARCNRLWLWRLKSGAKRQLGGKVTCHADATSTGRGVTAIALTSTRAAWIVNGGGNSESVDTLLASPLSRPHETRVARAVRVGDVDGALAGGWLGGLVSDGRTIAANAWRTAVDGSGGTTVTSASLRRVTSTGTRRVASGAGTIVAGAADGGRIAVLRSEGTVALYLVSGRLLRVVTPTAPGTKVALSGSRLAVLTSAGKIEVYSTRNGARGKTRKAAGKVTTRIDLQGRRVVYGVGRRLYSLDLAGGRTRLFASAPRAIVDVQVEASGVLYAWNGVSGGRSVGHVVFLPA